MWSDEGSSSAPSGGQMSGGGWGTGRGFHHGVWGGKGHPKGKGNEENGRGEGWTSFWVGRGLYMEEYDDTGGMARPYGRTDANGEWADIGWGGRPRG